MPHSAKSSQVCNRWTELTDERDVPVMDRVGRSSRPGGPFLRAQRQANAQVQRHGSNSQRKPGAMDRVEMPLQNGQYLRRTVNVLALDEPVVALLVTFLEQPLC